MTLVHDDAIDWPNGEGYTPCTREYRTKMDEKDRIYDPNYEAERGELRRTLDDLSPEDYQRWMELDSDLGQMQMNGHLGKGMRFA